MEDYEMVRKTKYHSIDEIPDSLVMRDSKRDPDNKIYKTRRWYDFKKKQILFTQNDGVPSHLRTPLRRFSYYSIYTSAFVMLGYNFYLYNYYTSKKKN